MKLYDVEIKSKATGSIFTGLFTKLPNSTMLLEVIDLQVSEWLALADRLMDDGDEIDADVTSSDARDLEAIKELIPFCEIQAPDIGTTVTKPIKVAGTSIGTIKVTGLEAYA